MILHDIHARLRPPELLSDSYSDVPVMTSRYLQTLPAYSLLNKMADAIILIDTAGTIEFMNHNAMKLMDSPYEKVRGQGIKSLFIPIDYNTLLPIPEPADWFNAHTSGSFMSQYIKLQRHDGRMLTVDITVTRLNRNNEDTSELLILAIRDVSRYQAHLDNMTKAARYDDHTQLLRRTELERRLTRVLESMRAGDQHALLFMDLDHFKQINDTAGHLVGDRALRKVASLFRHQIRERDTLARLGGDEFGLLLEHCPLQLAIERAKSLQAVLANNRFSANGYHFMLDVSIGIAAFHNGNYSAQKVLEAADAACYHAKRQHREGSRISSSIMD